MALYGVSRPGQAPSASELKTVRSVVGQAPIAELKQQMLAGDIFAVWDSEDYGLDEELADHLQRIEAQLAGLRQALPGLQFHYSPAEGDEWEAVSWDVLCNLMESELEIFGQQN